MKRRVLVTGGCGYVGSRLVPALADDGYEVTALDCMMFGDGGLAADRRVRLVRGDVRDAALVSEVVRGQDTIVHLAFVSNDPEYELDPQIGESINLGGFERLLAACRGAGVSRFVFPSSCSVYGRRDEAILDEDAPVAPITDYARHKVACEAMLLGERRPGFVPVVLRPATVMGAAPRLRLDLMVNGWIAQACFERRIVVRNGSCVRPLVHIDDLVDVYRRVLAAAADQVAGAVLNVAGPTATALAAADEVRAELPADLELVPSGVDGRSYRVSSQRLAALGFVAQRTVRHAARTLASAFAAGTFADAPAAARYYNKRVQRTFWR
jgi:nucleoside-diphosphate-sugar epimerase